MADSPRPRRVAKKPVKAVKSPTKKAVKKTAAKKKATTKKVSIEKQTATSKTELKKGCRNPTAKSLDTVLKKDVFSKYDGSFFIGNDVKLPPRASTGHFILDYYLSGGYKENCVQQIYGPEQTGKTRMGYMAIAIAQRKYKGKVAVLADLEQAYEESFAKMCGVDTSRLYVLQDTIPEFLLNKFVEFCQVPECCFMLFDSIGAINPTINMEKGFHENEKLGELAKIAQKLSQTTMHLLNDQHKLGFKKTILFLNQLRSKIGAKQMFPGHEPTQPCGGRNFRHNMSISIELKKAYASKKRVVDGVNEIVEMTTPFALNKNRSLENRDGGELIWSKAQNHGELPVSIYTSIDAHTIKLYAHKHGLIQRVDKGRYILNIDSAPAEFKDLEFDIDSDSLNVMMYETPSLRNLLRNHTISEYLKTRGFKKEVYGPVLRDEVYF